MPDYTDTVLDDQGSRLRTRDDSPAEVFVEGGCILRILNGGLNSSTCLLSADGTTYQLRLTERQMELRAASQDRVLHSWNIFGSNHVAVFGVSHIGVKDLLYVSRWLKNYQQNGRITWKEGGAVEILLNRKDWSGRHSTIIIHPDRSFEVEDRGVFRLKERMEPDPEDPKLDLYYLDFSELGGHTYHTFVHFRMDLPSDHPGALEGSEPERPYYNYVRAAIWAWNHL